MAWTSAMNPQGDPRELLVYRAGLFVLFTSALGAGLAAVLHFAEAQPRTLDLVLPGSFALSQLALFVWVFGHPQRVRTAIQAGSVAGFAVLAIPAWVYPLAALRTGERLVDTLPPMSSGLVPLVLVLIVFARPRFALPVATAAWLAVALPILGYLALRPDELRSPRGLDLLIMLGPVMLIVLVFIPFHRGIDRWVAALQRDRAKLAELAERDGLTGLYNRRASETLIGNLLAEPDAEDALILFDIDRFKSINDTHGHPAGDDVLRQVARRCEAVLRRGDLFARWGGEEFLVLVRGARDDGGARVAESLRTAISTAPIAPVGRVTASFGVARFDARDTIETWLQRADGALYRAKQEGRDRVVVA
jgi:diguanylate cyclase (GGDEF)-like protein